MRASLLLGLLVVVVVAGARPAAAETLAVVDVPAPVEAALRTTLRPWKVDVVVVAPPATYDPAAVAAEHGAAYVAWRRGDHLVLYDAALAAEERRSLPRDLDDAEATAVALSVKTWMGLGPLPSDDGCGPADCLPRPRPPPWLIEVATGIRLDAADRGGVSFRYGLGVGHRRGRYEVGLRVDLGVHTDGMGFGQSGSWSVVGASAWGRVVVQLRSRLELLPGIGIGLVHTTFVAVKTGAGTHDEQDSATALGLDGSVGVRWRRGPFAVGARLGLTMIPSTQMLKARSQDEPVDPHVEPWALATAALAL